MNEPLIKKAEAFQKIRDSPTIRYYTKWWKYLDYLNEPEVEEAESTPKISGILPYYNTPRIVLSGQKHIIFEGRHPDTTVINGPPRKSLYSKKEDGMIRFHLERLQQHLRISTRRGDKVNKKILLIPPRKGHAAHHIEIFLAERSTLNIEVIQASWENMGLNTVTIEVHGEREARINMFNILLQNKKTPLFYELRIVGGNKQKTRIGNIVNGGKMTHFKISSLNRDPGSSTEIKSTLIAGRNTSTDHITDVINKASRTRGVVNVIGFGLGGYMVHQGTIRAEKEALKSINRLSSRMIPIEKESILVSVPKLEITTPYVEEGTHSSDISIVKEDELFYLATRGFSKDETMELMLNSAILDSIILESTESEQLRLVEEVASFIKYQ